MAAAAAALRRQTSCTCTCSGYTGDEPQKQERRRLSSAASFSSAGGLCLREDCARCNGTGSTVRKAVRFAATDQCVSSGVPTAANATAQEPAAASTAKTPEAAAAGWCQFACCWPSLPTLWWPRCCCAWNCHCCSGCWC